MVAAALERRAKPRQRSRAGRERIAQLPTDVRVLRRLRRLLRAFDLDHQRVGGAKVPPPSTENDTAAPGPAAESARYVGVRRNGLNDRYVTQGHGRLVGDAQCVVDHLALFEQPRGHEAVDLAAGRGADVLAHFGDQLGLDVGRLLGAACSLRACRQDDRHGDP